MNIQGTQQWYWNKKLICYATLCFLIFVFSWWPYLLIMSRPWKVKCGDMVYLTTWLPGLVASSLSMIFLGHARIGHPYQLGMTTVVITYHSCVLLHRQGHIDSSTQYCHNCRALTMKLQQSCVKPPVPGEFPAHKGQWHGAFMFSLICVWINDWVNNREAGDLRRYRAHYDVIVMW